MNLLQRFFLLVCVVYSLCKVCLINMSHFFCPYTSQVVSEADCTHICHKCPLAVKSEIIVVVRGYRSRSQRYCRNIYEFVFRDDMYRFWWSTGRRVRSSHNHKVAGGSHHMKPWLHCLLLLPMTCTVMSLPTEPNWDFVWLSSEEVASQRTTSYLENRWNSSWALVV